MRFRLALASALTLFLVLSGTGAGYALWSSQAGTTATVVSGTHSFVQATFSDLAVNYTPSNLARQAAVEIKNSGTISAPYTLSFTAQAANNLARAVTVRVWQTDSACTASTPVPDSATSSTWEVVPAFSTSSLGAGRSVYYCVRTSITSDQANNLSGTDSMTALLSLTSTVGSWTTSVSASAEQYVPDFRGPSAPAVTSSNTSGYSTKLTWPASTDNIGVTGYEVQRNGVVVANLTSPNYTDATLAGGATYSYTVRARDAAGNYSAASSPVAVTALPVSSARTYQIIGQNSGLCVDSDAAKYTDGNPIIVHYCHNGPNQSWMFVPTTDGYYRIASKGATASVISVQPGGSADDRVPLQLWTYNGAYDREWQVTQKADGFFVLTARSNGRCMDVRDNSTQPGTAVQQYLCNGTSAETFNLRAE